MPDLKVTLIQTSLHWENVEANLRQFESIISPLENSTDLIILPEMFSTGFSMKTEELAEEMTGNAVEWMRRMAKEVNAVITGSLMIRDGGKFYNRLVWMRPDGTFEHYDKRHLFGLGDEHKYYSAGNKRLIVSLKKWNVCPLVCYDLRFPVWCRNRRQTSDDRRQQVNSQQYDVLIFVANWPERRSFAWKHLLQARAIENQSYVIGVNRIGNDGQGIYHSGDSAVIDPMGEVVFTQADTFFARTLTLSKERLEFVRSKMPFLEDGDGFGIAGT
jgi:predicted amidohydrolase